MSSSSSSSSSSRIERHDYYCTAYDRASGRVNDPGADDIITASKLSG